MNKTADAMTIPLESVSNETLSQTQTEERQWERFYIQVSEDSRCLILDSHGNGFEARLSNIGIGGLCIEMLHPAVGGLEMSPPIFDIGHEFEFSGQHITKWGRYIDKRKAFVRWREGSTYGCQFTEPLGTVPAGRRGLFDRVRTLFDRMRYRIWHYRFTHRIGI